MRNNLPLMKLFPDEDVFLRHWMYDEVHYKEGRGIAKTLQLQNEAIPADLAALIAAAMPNASEQMEAGETPPMKSPTWPWASKEELQKRVEQARSILASRREQIMP